MQWNTTRPLKKKNEILQFATTWMDLQGIMLSEVSQRNTISRDLPYMWNSRKQMKKQNRNIIIDTENKQVVVKEWGLGRREKQGREIKKCKLPVVKQ